MKGNYLQRAHEVLSIHGQHHSPADHVWEDEELGLVGWSLTMRQDLSLTEIWDLSVDCRRCSFHSGSNIKQGSGLFDEK